MDFQANEIAKRVKIQNGRHLKKITYELMHIVKQEVVSEIESFESGVDLKKE